jgi:hypothetical protein
VKLKFTLVCLGLTPLLIAASQPVRLRPSSPWDVDYAANSCRLIRNFGTGKTLTKLAFESSTPADMDMMAIGEPIFSHSDMVPARFLPTTSKNFDGKVVKTTDGAPAILWPGVEFLPDEAIADEAEQDHGKDHPGVRPPGHSLAEQAVRKALHQSFASATSELEIQTSWNRPVILETGSMGEAVRALDKCSEDSLKDWGVDPKLEAQIVRPVFALNPTHWISSDDYPLSLSMNGEESSVLIRLLIDAQGGITKCTAVTHYNEAEFNRITCDLVGRRAKFLPAQLADGTKVPSYYAQRVIFRIAR